VTLKTGSGAEKTADILTVVEHRRDIKQNIVVTSYPFDWKQARIRIMSDLRNSGMGIEAKDLSGTILSSLRTTGIHPNDYREAVEYLITSSKEAGMGEEKIIKAFESWKEEKSNLSIQGKYSNSIGFERAVL